MKMYGLIAVLLASAAVHAMQEEEIQGDIPPSLVVLAARMVGSTLNLPRDHDGNLIPSAISGIIDTASCSNEKVRNIIASILKERYQGELQEVASTWMSDDVVEPLDSRWVDESVYTTDVGTISRQFLYKTPGALDPQDVIVFLLFPEKGDDAAFVDDSNKKQQTLRGIKKWAARVARAYRQRLLLLTVVPGNTPQETGARVHAFLEQEEYSQGTRIMVLGYRKGCGSAGYLSHAIPLSFLMYLGSEGKALPELCPDQVGTFVYVPLADDCFGFPWVSTLVPILPGMVAYGAKSFHRAANSAYLAGDSSLVLQIGRASEAVVRSMACGLYRVGGFCAQKPDLVRNLGHAGAVFALASLAHRGYSAFQTHARAQRERDIFSRLWARDSVAITLEMTHGAFSVSRVHLACMLALFPAIFQDIQGSFPLYYGSLGSVFSVDLNTAVPLAMVKQGGVMRDAGLLPLFGQNKTVDRATLGLQDLTNEGIESMRRKHVACRGSDQAFQEDEEGLAL